MNPLLDQHGVTVVAISKDTPALAAAHRVRDELTLTLLTDSDLDVIRAFGLLHEGAIEFRTFLVGGVRFPLGWPVGFKRMAIPTTLLLDEKRVVRWIDQADDYRVRGDEERTRAALAETYG
ncbi:MAG: redoxin domain-containing protein [Proteobacteria bacterium]|nr:redoxin domain-containing protein [Pseudomonadota bacterium]MCP4916211.1 redoxin domain-containing protein [Pseudomonadota bacterium]